MKQEDFLHKIKSAVLAHDADAQVILYGSPARNEAREDSDWDILIVKNKVADYSFQRKIRDAVYDVELAYDEPVSTIIVDTREWKKMEITPLYRNIEREGITV